jgi:uncharacterized membrane protein YbhN (UPF0104 family)
VSVTPRPPARGRRQARSGVPNTPAPASEASRAVAGGLRGTLRLLGRYKRVVRLAALALIILFVALAVQQTWAKLPRDFHWTVNWPLLTGGFLLLAAQELSFAFIWRAILARLGSQLDIRGAQQIYLGSEFVRYIPGNVWHVFTRILWAEQRGVPRVTGLASMTVELATKIASAALVFALTLLVWPDVQGLASALGRGVPFTIGLVAAPLLLVGLHPRLLTSTLSFGLRKLGRQPVTFALRYRDVLAITLLWSASWVVAGVGFYLLILALAPAPFSLAALVIATGIYALAWDIGFLSFVTPSGLGFREGALAILLGLAGVVTVPALALVIAVVARLAGTAAELVCVSGAHLLPGGRAPAIAPSEQRA